MVKQNIGYQEIKRAVKRLPTLQPTRLLEELQRDTWQDRFRQLLARIDACLAKHPIPHKDILAIVRNRPNK